MKQAGSKRIGIGALLLALGWAGNWGLSGVRTHALFFPQWLGAILLFDGILVRRSGTSPATRSPAGFGLLFVLSIPFWWLFEAFNERLGNWEYLGADTFTDGEYAFWATLSFSTVVPAMFELAELARGMRFIERFARGPVLRATPRFALGLFLTGAGMALLMLVWPRYFYPFVWTSMVLMLEAVCFWTGRRGLLTDLARGDWRPWMSLWIGGLLCGFLWELWNFWSWPKWVYHVPGVDFARVFEMPLLGYLGYLPFAHELYLGKQLLLPRLPAPRLSDETG